MSNPLGRYSNIGAFLASLAIVGVWAAQHLLAVNDPDVNQLVLLALGILFGQVGAHTEAIQVAAAKINGLERAVNQTAAKVDALSSN